MENFALVLVIAAFLVAVLYLLLVVFEGTGSVDKRREAREAREAREQAEFDRRGQAALDALRELGRKYPRR